MGASKNSQGYQEWFMCPRKEAPEALWVGGESQSAPGMASVGGKITSVVIAKTHPVTPGWNCAICNWSWDLQKKSWYAKNNKIWKKNKESMGEPKKIDEIMPWSFIISFENQKLCI